MKKIFIFCALCAYIVIVTFINSQITHSNIEIPSYNSDLTIFTNPLEFPVKFVIMGDSRHKLGLEFGKDEIPYTFRQKIPDKIHSTNPHFIVHNGDLVGIGSSSSDWKKFDTEYSFVWKDQIPIYPVLGNHEYKYDVRNAMRNFFGRFKGLNAQKDYIFKVGHAAFVILDSNFSYKTEKELQTQSKWYLKTLNMLQADNKITLISVCCHHTPFTNSTVHSDNKAVLEKFFRPLSKITKAKIFIAGHVHSYEKFYSDNITIIVTGGAGAPLYKLSPDSNHKDVSKWKGERGNNFLYCELFKDKISFIVYGLDNDTWEVKEEFEIKL
ncbi:MAG: metallophosphoesterase [Planctomycetes bacterium]|nr:metallophosphoesterase [Planctomycetota bacterium]